MDSGIQQDLPQVSNGRVHPLELPELFHGRANLSGSGSREYAGAAFGVDRAAIERDDRCVLGAVRSRF